MVILLLLWTVQGFALSAQAEHGSSVPACNLSLAWHLPGFADKQRLDLLEELILEAGRKFPGAKQHRYFGVDKTNVGHAVTYLNTVASSKVLLDLWTAAASADQAANWHIADTLGLEGSRLQLRCFESIDYVSEGHDANIGWHSDGATLLTVAIMLSKPTEFEGGSFEIRRPLRTMPPHDCGNIVSIDSMGRGQASVALARGDALVWRGWDEHRVAPVLRGRRRVAVLEWWTDPETGPSAKNPRPDDSHRGWALAQRIDPLSAALPRAQAEQYRAEGDLDKAVSTYRRALTIDPIDPLSLTNLASVFSEQGALDEALASFQESFQLDPTEVTTQLGLSNALRDLGRVEEATAMAEGAVRSDPQSSDAHVAVGNIRLQTGQLQDAKSAFKKAVRLNPRKATAYSGLAGVYKSAGNFKKSLKAYRKSLNLDPKDGNVHNNLGGLFMQMARLNEALSSYETAVTLNPRSGSLHANLGIALGNMGMIDRAGESFETALKLGPPTPVLHKNLAKLRRHERNYKDARVHLQEVLRLDPLDQEAESMLAGLQQEL